MPYFFTKQPTIITFELKYGYQEGLGYKKTITKQFELGKYEGLEKNHPIYPSDFELELIRISAKQGSKIDAPQLSHMLANTLSEKNITRLDLSGLSLKGQFAGLLKTLINLNIQVNHLNVSNTGLTDSDLLSTVAQMTNETFAIKSNGCLPYHKAKYKAIIMEEPNFLTIDLSHNALSFNGFSCLKLLQLNNLFTEEIIISGNKHLTKKLPKTTSSPHYFSDHYKEALKIIYTHIKSSYFFSKNPDVFSLVPELFRIFPKTKITMDSEQAKSGMLKLFNMHEKLPIALKKPSAALVNDKKEPIQALAITDEILRSSVVIIDSKCRYKRLIIIADAVEITKEASIDFDYLAIMADTIIIKGLMQGDSNSLLQIKARNQLIIDPTASLIASSINVTTCHLYHYGKSHMTQGKWQVAGLFLHGSLLTPSSIAAQHLDIIASIYIQSPMASLLSSGSSISWLSLNTGLTMPRTHYALLNASLFSDIPLLAHIMQSPDTIYQLIPMISTLLSNAFYIKKQPKLLTSLSAQALLHIFKGLLTMLSAANPHVFSSMMLLNITTQMPALAKGFYDCYQKIQHPEPLTLADSNASDFVKAMTTFNNEHAYESFLMAMELSSRTASLLVQSLRARYLISQYWSGLQSNVLSLKTANITSYLTYKIGQISQTNLRDATQVFTTWLPINNVMSLFSMSKHDLMAFFVALIPEHETISVLDISLLSIKALSNTKSTTGLQISLACASVLSRENSLAHTKVISNSHVSLSNSTHTNVHSIEQNSSLNFFGQNSINTTHFDNQGGLSIGGESLHLNYEQGDLGNTDISIKTLSLKANNALSEDMITHMLERSGDYKHFCPKHIDVDFNGDYHHSTSKVNEHYQTIGIHANSAAIDALIALKDTHLQIESKLGSTDINECVDAKSVTVISNQDITLADKHNGIISRLSDSNDPEFLNRQKTINAKTIYLKAKHNIINNGSASSIGEFSMHAGNNVHNYGYLKASDGMLSIDATEVYNHHSSKEEKAGKHKKTFIFVKAEISGGWGNNSQHIGLAISAKKIINDGATLSAKGLVRAYAEKGVENLTVTYQPNATKHTYPQTQVYSGTIISGEEGSAPIDPEAIAIFIQSDGYIVDQSGNYATINGGKVCLSSHTPMDFKYVTVSYGEKKTKKSFFSTTKTKEMHYVQIPATFYTDGLILMNDQLIKGILPITISSTPIDDKSIQKKNISFLSPSIELVAGTHEVKKTVTQKGLQATLSILGNIGINLIKQPQQGSILDAKLFLDNLNDLLQAKDPLDLLKGMYALSLSYPDAAKEVFNTIWYNAPFKHEKLLPQLIHPQLQLILSQSKQSISSTQKGIGSIDANALTIIARIKCQLDGIDVTAEKASIKTPLFIHSGAPYTQESSSQSAQFSLGSQHFGVSMQTENRSQEGITPAMMNIGFLHADIGEWQARGTDTNIKDSSGKIGLLTLSNTSTITRHSRQYATIATNTLVGAEKAMSQHAIFEPSSFQIHSSSNDMTINSVINTASFFKRSGVAVGQYEERSYTPPVKIINKKTGLITTLSAWSNPDLNTITRFHVMGISMAFITPHLFENIEASAPIEHHSVIDSQTEAQEPQEKKTPTQAKKPEKTVEKPSAAPQKEAPQSGITKEEAQQLFNSMVHDEYVHKMAALDQMGLTIIIEKKNEESLKSANNLVKSIGAELTNMSEKLISGEPFRINTDFFLDAMISCTYNYIVIAFKGIKYTVDSPYKLNTFYNKLYDEEMIDKHLSDWEALQQKGFYWQNNRKLSERYHLFLQYEQGVISSNNAIYSITFKPTKQVINSALDRAKQIIAKRVDAVETTVVNHIKEPERFETDILKLGFFVAPHSVLLTDEIKQQILNDKERRDLARVAKNKR